MQVREMQQPIEQIDGIFEKLFSKTLIVVGILVGILLIWIGSIVTTFGTMTSGSSLDAYKASIVLSSLGIAAMGVFLVGGGVANKNIDKYVRLAMIIGGVLLLTGLFSIATLGLSSGSISSLSSLFGSY